MNDVKPSIIEVASLLGYLPEKQRGDRFVGGKCPSGHDSAKGVCFNIWDAGNFECFHCGAKGDVYALIQLVFKCDFKEAKQWCVDRGLVSDNGKRKDNVRSFKSMTPKKEIKRPTPKEDEGCHQEIWKHRNALTYLKNRGINEQTIKHFKLGYMCDKEGEWLTIPYYQNGVLVCIKRRTIAANSKDFRRTKDAAKTLFNVDCIPGYTEIIITEGELDAISCWQSGYKNVVSVPNGVNSFEPEFIDELQNMEKIYLWYDNDEPGIKESDAIAERLGLERCYFVRVDDYKDANDYFLSHKQIDLTMAKKKKISHVIPFQESVARIFERRHTAQTEIKTPWNNVNRLVRNIEPGDLITLSATPKIGKTSLALNIATYNAKQGHPVFFYCLEMRPERLASKIISSEGMVQEDHLTPELVTSIARRLSEMPLYFGHNFKNIEADKVFDTIRAAVLRYGIKFLIFDHLHFLVRSLAHTTAEIGILSRRFKLLAEELRIPILLIAQPRKVEEDKVMTMNDLKDSSSIGADSDQVLILWRKKTKSKLNSSEGCESSYEPKTLVRVDASRFTPGGDTVLMFRGDISRFEEISNDKSIFGG